MKPFTTIAVIIFAVICIAHIARVIMDVGVRLGTHDVPQWVSIAGALVAGIMAIMLWRERK
jgi:hypothetical protein